MAVIYAFRGLRAAIEPGFAPEVTMGQLRSHVLRRDHHCILAETAFPGHRCVGKWGGSPASMLRDEDWTLEHVTQVHSHLEGRKDDDAHTVALCHGTNLKPPSKVEREAMRVHLRLLYPECPDA